MCFIQQYIDASMANTNKTLDSCSVKSILIADDSAHVRYIIREFLKDVPDVQICGEAVDGVDAIEKARKLKPNLILLDLSMPRMNGVEVASILKKSMPDVLIILFTMYSDNLGKALASTIGFDAVLAKPDGMRHLVNTIGVVLASHKPT
jgi:DNA-binding NarL/FixJ family response regulator